MNPEQVVRLVYRKDYAALREAVAQGADVSAVDKHGSAPLMHAVCAEHADAEMVRFLIESGADPCAAEPPQGWTPLHVAARDQKMEIVAILLAHGAEINAQDSFGNTPLWRCVMYAKPNPNMVRYLLGKGADPLMKNKHGSSARDVAKTMGKTELVRLLDGESQAGVDPPVAVVPCEIKAVPHADEPFMEHPTGEFADAVSAMESAIARLRSLGTWDRWIEFGAQGQGGRPDSYRFAEVRLRGQEIDVGGLEIDLPRVLREAGLKEKEISVGVGAEGVLSVSGADPKQLARFLDGLFRACFGIRPIDDDKDYAVGAEWCEARGQS